jgi:hypothetical protein
LIRICVFAFLICFILNGCIGVALFGVSAVGAVSTTQEVEERYNGDVINYASDKANNVYQYLKKKSERN